MATWKKLLVVDSGDNTWKENVWLVAHGGNTWKENVAGVVCICTYLIGSRKS